MFKVAGIQICSVQNHQENISRIKALIGKAADSGAKLIVLPEDCISIPAFFKDKIHVAKKVSNNSIIEKISNIAKSCGVWVIVGGVPIIQGSTDKFYNRLFVINDKGLIISKYDKIHLFDISLENEESYYESRYVIPGKDIVVCSSPFGQLGLSVCYDLRFPELYRLLVQKGANVIIVTAAFTKNTGIFHWKELLIARAIENFCFVIAINQTGKNAMNDTWGHSIIIGPWGNVISELGSEEDIIIADIDLQEVDRCRKQIPAIKNTKLLSSITGHAKL